MSRTEIEPTVDSRIGKLGRSMQYLFRRARGMVPFVAGVLAALVAFLLYNVFVPARLN